MLQRSPRRHLAPLAIFVFALLAVLLLLQTPNALAQPAAQKDVPHPVAGQEKCLLCHQAGGLKPAPANHASYPETLCLNCHKAPSAAAQPTTQPTKAAAQPTPAPSGGIPGVTHTLQGRDDCLACHKAGGAKPVPANHASYTNQLCLSCHKAAPAAQPTAQPTAAPAQPTSAPAQPTKAPAQPTQAPMAASIPNITHAVEGRDDCLLCHKIGGMKPVPANHAVYDNKVCQTCH